MSQATSVSVSLVASQSLVFFVEYRNADPRLSIIAPSTAIPVRVLPVIGSSVVTVVVVGGSVVVDVGDVVDDTDEVVVLS